MELRNCTDPPEPRRMQSSAMSWHLCEFDEETERAIADSCMFGSPLPPGLVGCVTSVSLPLTEGDGWARVSVASETATGAFTLWAAYEGESPYDVSDEGALPQRLVDLVLHLDRIVG